MRWIFAATLPLVALVLWWPVDAYGGWGSGGCAPAFGPVGPSVFQPMLFPAPSFPQVQAVDNAAHVVVNVPADARVWFNDAPTRQTGICREFASPPIEPGRTYTYTIRASWAEDGRDVSQEQAVDVQAGGRAVVDFTRGVRDARTSTDGGTKANYGLVEDRIGRHGETYTINGQPVAGQEALRLIEKPEIPDDSKAMRVTVIGPKDECQRVLQDLATSPALANYRDRLVVRDHRPDDWSVARTGFVTSGHPTIYLQAPDGTVLHRQDAYAGPDKLAEAIRKADPTYNPAQDPDVTKPLINAANLAPVAVLGLAVLVALGLIFAGGRQTNADQVIEESNG